MRGWNSNLFDLGYLPHKCSLIDGSAHNLSKKSASGGFFGLWIFPNPILPLSLRSARLPMGTRINLFQRKIFLLPRLIFWSKQNAPAGCSLRQPWRSFTITKMRGGQIFKNFVLYKLMTNENKTSGFYGLGIAPAILEVLEKLNFKSPTPIQEKAIPGVIEGKDIVGIAQTGTGKTLAFGIPMLQKFLQSPTGNGLIVVPTRELALQVDEAIRSVSHSFGIKTAVLIGGTSLGPQVQQIRKGPRIVIATPGRLIDHLNQQNIRLNNVAIVVLDEADRMLDMGFLPQIRKIFQGLPPKESRQTMLFSATMPPEVMQIAAGHMKLPIRVEIAPAGTTVEKVTQELFI